ncbi:MAG: MBL fold metallo-hydrolase [Pseudomonadota bacterium]
MSHRAGILTSIGCATGSVCAPAFAQLDFEAAEIRTTELRGGVYLLEGLGGNIAVSIGDDGVLLIDDEFAQLTPKLVAAVSELTDQPVNFVINTHWHLDHTGGNNFFAKDGALIVAHDNVRARLETDAPEEWGAEGLPVITFSDTTTFYFNEADIHVFHPGHAHTDGDAVIHYRNLDILHAGDIYWNGYYPRIDLQSGGSVNGAIATLERLVSLSGPETHIIPGHGPLATKADLERDLAMMQNAKARISALIEDGKSLPETLAAKPLADYDEAGYGSFFIRSDQLIRAFYQDLSAR